MTDDASSADDFDRIVEGLDLDLTGLDDFDASAARAARERDEDERRRQAAAERAEDPSTPVDEQFYREVGPADLRADGRIRAAWSVVVGGPALLVLAMIASLRPSPVIVMAVIAAVVGAVVYLIARLPDHGPSNPDWPDDGAAL